MKQVPKLSDLIEASQKTLDLLKPLEPIITQAAQALAESLAAGSRVLIAGNGEIGRAHV